MNRQPKRPANREKIFDVLDGERDYQDEHFPMSPEPTLLDMADLLDEYAIKLMNLFAPPASPSHAQLTGDARTAAVLKKVREIGALAIKAMELHGAVPRENHVPASAGITGEMHASAKPDALAPRKG